MYDQLSFPKKEEKMRDEREMQSQILRGRKYAFLWLSPETLESERVEFVQRAQTSKPLSPIAKALADCFFGNAYLCYELRACLVPREKANPTASDYERLAAHVLRTSRPWNGKLLREWREAEQAYSEQRDLQSA